MSKYTLTIRGLESRDEARKIAEDYFGEMIWKRETGCMTCWPQRDKHPLTITDSDADGKVVADLHAEVRRLRREANDVFECADGTVAKDATVAAQSWADECRRLRAERDATLAHLDEAEQALNAATERLQEFSRAMARQGDEKHRFRDVALALRQHLALFCGPDDAIARALFERADALIRGTDTAEGEG